MCIWYVSVVSSAWVHSVKVRGQLSVVSSVFPLRVLGIELRSPGLHRQAFTRS